MGEVVRFPDEGKVGYGAKLKWNGTPDESPAVVRVIPITPAAAEEAPEPIEPERSSSARRRRRRVMR